MGVKEDRIKTNANEAWLEAIASLHVYGDKSSPRGMLTIEDSHTTVLDMKSPVLTIPERRLGYYFMAAEAHWILSGDNRVKTIKPFSNIISRFSDDGETFFGAYGPRIRKQLPYIVDTLTRDSDSRQAVITTWRESPPITKDVPCTVSIQFIIRKNKLNTFVTMRSCDLWLGWPYDVFNMSMLSYYVLAHLREYSSDFWTTDIGTLDLRANCLHLYERNDGEALDILGLYDGSTRPSSEYPNQPDISYTEDRPETLLKKLEELKTSGKLKPY